jgi:hypothetical protein
VDVGVSHTVRTAVVLEGCDHPALRFDRGEPGHARGLQEAERLMIGRPGTEPQCLGLPPELLACFGVAVLVRLDRGKAERTVLGGEVGECFPGEVGEVALGEGELQQPERQLRRGGPDPGRRCRGVRHDRPRRPGAGLRSRGVAVVHGRSPRRPRRHRLGEAVLPPGPGRGGGTGKHATSPVPGPCRTCLLSQVRLISLLQVVLEAQLLRVVHLEAG